MPGSDAHPAAVRLAVTAGILRPPIASFYDLVGTMPRDCLAGEVLEVFLALGTDEHGHSGHDAANSLFWSRMPCCLEAVTIAEA